MAGVAELLAGFFEGVGQDGEEDFAGGAADEIVAALLLDELELGRHAVQERSPQRLKPMRVALGGTAEAVP